MVAAKSTGAVQPRAAPGLFEQITAAISAGRLSYEDQTKLMGTAQRVVELKAHLAALSLDSDAALLASIKQTAENL